MRILTELSTTHKFLTYYDTPLLNDCCIRVSHTVQPDNYRVLMWPKPFYKTWIIADGLEKHKPRKKAESKKAKLRLGKRNVTLGVIKPDSTFITSRR